MDIRETVVAVTKYKDWANEKMFSAVSNLPDGEAIKQRMTGFGNMVHTLNHIYVIDDIFKSHLLSVPHNYQSRNTASHPPLSVLWQRQKAMDNWYIEYVQRLSDSEFSEVVEFEFVDGGNGAMSRTEIILHVVNHGTYHRGYVANMMYQASVKPPAIDFPVYLRELKSA